MSDLIWFIHGAGASSRSFRWLIEQLPPARHRFVNHNLDTGLMGTLRTLQAEAERSSDSITVVGHSLGGVLAAGLMEIAQVESVVTICAPFGGLPGAAMASLFNSAPLFSDMTFWSPPLKRIRTMPVTKPNLAIYGTAGLPFTVQPNDGIVTVESAVSKYDMNYRPLPYNHFEVLLAEETAKHLEDFLADQRVFA